MIKHILALAGLAVLPLAACGAGDPAPTEEAATPPASEETALPAADDPETSALAAPLGDELTGAVNGEVITIADLEMGDIACYLITEADAVLLADFDLCDDALVGTRQIPTYTESEIMSPACEGDMNCELTVTERLVVALQPAD